MRKSSTVWHEGLLYKLYCLLPKNAHKVLSSYIKNRTFRVRENEYITNEFNINAGVLQGSVIGPLLYLLFLSDIPTSNEILLSTFADDTALLSVNSCHFKASAKTYTKYRNLVSELAHKS